MPASQVYFSELRLFLEDICCDLCLLDDLGKGEMPTDAVRIDREYHLGAPSVFADIRVQVAGQRPFFLEVKFGQPRFELVRRLQRKYGLDTEPIRQAEKLVLVVDVARRNDWAEVEPEIRAVINPKLQLEVWDEAHLQALIQRRLGVNTGAITARRLLTVRDRFEAAMGFQAFGGESLEEYRNDPLRSALLWHLGATQVRLLRQVEGRTPRQMLPPQLYRRVAVMMADLACFSSYVRDTRDPAVIRESLTSFYTKSRYEIIHRGGMLYQFVGDAVIAFFGVPRSLPRSADRCLSVAKSLLDIGDSVATHWQRRIDRVQPSGGAHIGLTMGDVEIMSLRPFSRTRVGAVSDSINLASRLVAAARAGEIVVSNSFFHELTEERKQGFVELEPLEARNVGMIKAWKLSLASRYTSPQEPAQEAAMSALLSP